MRSSVIFSAVILCGLFSLTLAQSDWIGVWQDRCKDDDCYGGRLYTCIQEVGNAVYLYGTYSDIGYIVGVVDGDKVTGSWYEAGYEDLNYGGFEWKLLRKDDEVVGFSGNWYNEKDICLRYAWYAPKIEDKPNNNECGGLLPQLRESGGNIEGRWTYTGPINPYSIDSDDLYICLDNGDYFHASNDPGANFTSMYFSGSTKESDQIGQASTWSSAGQGIALLVLIDNNQLMISEWAVDSNVAALDLYDTPSLHRTYIYRKSPNSISQSNLQQRCNLQAPLNGASNWFGTFYDPRFGNGRFYVCPTTGNLVQGVYSELGFISGQTNGNVLSGNWYNAGTERGSFTIQLENSGHSFSGFYQENGGNQISWEADRVDVTSAYAPANCWVVPDTGSPLDLEGEWYYGNSPGDVFDICIDGNGVVTASYQYNGHVQGYGEGRATSGGASIQMTWYEENTQGISIYRYNAGSDTMLESLWAAVNNVDDIYYEICDEEELDYQYWGLHSVNHNIKRVTNLVTQQQCQRNSKLKSVSPELSTYENDYFYSPPAGSASSLSISLILLFTTLLFL